MHPPSVLQLADESMGYVARRDGIDCLQTENRVLQEQLGTVSGHEPLGLLDPRHESQSPTAPGARQRVEYTRLRAKRSGEATPKPWRRREGPLHQLRPEPTARRHKTRALSGFRRPRRRGHRRVPCTRMPRVDPARTTRTGSARTPPASHPQRRNARNSSSTNRGRPSPSRRCAACTRRVSK